mmetsp:Transcript_11206/g.11266  ORF Transcript_11206/g.11266 Transcript_11206/m.11266 type:complete len:122 (+) Transcript_11206:1370-1735(+)
MNDKTLEMVANHLCKSVQMSTEVCVDFLESVISVHQTLTPNKSIQKAMVNSKISIRQLCQSLVQSFGFLSNGIINVLNLIPWIFGNHQQKLSVSPMISLKATAIPTENKTNSMGQYFSASK